ncbi:MAG: hypothetical protein IJ502_05820 [Alistipes sp.]|nr:hypothetical protein [Alistipes sp.]
MKRFVRLLLVAMVAVWGMACSEEPYPHFSDLTPEPKDEYLGEARSIHLKHGFEKFAERNVTLYVRTDEGVLIKRKATRKSSVLGGAHLALDHGLKDGRYELLYLEYDLPEEDQLEGFKKGHFGLSCRVEIAQGEVQLLDTWDATFRYYGKGTAENPFRISSYDQMIQLTLDVANTSLLTDEQIKQWEETHFLQTADINGRDMARHCSRQYGWIPIGFLNTTPFRSTFDGGGYKITGLEITRSSTCCVGLFGYTHGACIRNVHLTDATIEGDFAVGGIAGTTISSEGERRVTVFENCTVESSSITSHEGGYGVGGLLGCVDELTVASLHKCRSLGNTISATMNAGGMVGVGARSSAVIVGLSENSSTVTTDYGCVGGIVGVCDSLNMAACINRGAINGAVRYVEGDENNGLSNLGAGGIVGGTGMSVFTGCVNEGVVQGRIGVGGILGSTRFTGTFEGEDYVCQNAIFLYCGNSGSVAGEYIVGGICGEAQVGATGCYNAGPIIASGSGAGGILGVSQMAICENNVNTGTVTADTHAGGIAGITWVGNYMINHNYGSIYAANGYSAGILANGGRDITMNYCGNFGPISSSSSSDPIAGLLAECGDFIEAHTLIPDEAKYAIAGFEIVLGVVGLAGIPLAFVHTTNAVANGLMTAFSAVTFTASTLCWLYDDILHSYGIYGCLEMLDIEKMSQETREAIEAQLAQAKTVQQSMRSSFAPSSFIFSSNMLSYEYPNNVQKMIAFCASEGGDEQYNEALQAERIATIDDTIEKENSKMVNHQIVSGVAMLLGAVATVAGAAALILGSGGTALPAVIASMAGFASGVMGGVNTIVQTATATEYNLNEINESVNSGSISCPSSNAKAGGIVGVLHDYGTVADCLNTGAGSGGGGHLVGQVRSETTLRNSLSIAPASSWAKMAGEDGHDNTSSGLYYCVEAENMVASTADVVGTSASGLTLEQIARKESFVGWDIDGKSCWTIPAHVQKPFPIPDMSKYTK